MSDLLAKLRAMVAQGTAPANVWGVVREGPRESSDLRRILALPRRVLEPSEALADKWTERLKKPGGTMRLRPIQAAALEEAAVVDGLLGLLGVGTGKTLVSLLLATVWGSEDAALLVPPGLKKKLFDLELPVLSQHWNLPVVIEAGTQRPDAKAVLHVLPYSLLSSAKGADILQRIGADDIILDEAHCVRNASAARTKRFRRYARTQRPKPAPANLEGNDNRGGSQLLRRRIAALSGTITARSINDYAALSALVLGDGSPLPLDWNTVQEWSYALDPHDTPAPPGSLARLCGDGEPVRSGFRRRLIETPGVVATTENDPGMGLIFDRRALKVPKTVVDALDRLRREWVRPDGTPLRETLEVYAAARQLACGFFYRTVYPRNEPVELRREWAEARRAYFAEVRDRLSRNIAGQDSYLLLWRAAEAGKWASQHWARWARVHDAVKPDTETVWIDRFLIEAAAKWALEAPGIVWVEADALKAATAIAEAAGIPVYATSADAGALHREDGRRSVVLGIQAFNKGENLQHLFKRNLITACPPSGDVLEQAIGRTHRPRDPMQCGVFDVMADVTVDFYLHTPEIEGALADARERERYVEETQGTRRKLNMGSWLF